MPHKITDYIWVGNSEDEKSALRLAQFDVIDSVLIVANDMWYSSGLASNRWLQQMHVGIVDGPGNMLVTYHAAVLALASLVAQGHRVMVCCHSCSRSLAIVIMYQYLMGDGPSWDEAVERLKVIFNKMPELHEAHRRAFYVMDWGMLTRVLNEEIS
jgi:hypothetical protein